MQKLYITQIDEGDAGIYSCRATINNEEREKNLTLDLYSKYQQQQSAFPAVKVIIYKCNMYLCMITAVKLLGLHYV